MHITKCLETASSYGEELYANLLRQENKKDEDIIMKDIHRTIVVTNNMELKKSLDSKKDKLFNILFAYSNFDTEVGYVQGINYIANTILSNLNSERASFWLFSHIMNELNWRYMFVDSLPKLKRMINIFKIKVKEQLPEVASHIKSFGKGIFTALITPYFISIFSYNSPVEYANRVLDLFWFYQERIIMECLLHLLRLNEVYILSLEMDQMFGFIRDMVEHSINKFGYENCFPLHDKY